MSSKAPTAHPGAMLAGAYSGPRKPKSWSPCSGPFTTSVSFLQETSHAHWALWRASASHGGAGRRFLPCQQPVAPVLVCRLGPGCLSSGVWPRVPAKLWRLCVCVMGSEGLTGPCPLEQLGARGRCLWLLVLLRKLSVALWDEEGTGMGT